MSNYLLTSLIYSKRPNFLKWKSNNSTNNVYMENHCLHIKLANNHKIIITTGNNYEDEKTKIYQFNNKKEIRKLKIVKKSLYSNLVILDKVQSKSLDKFISNNNINYLDDNNLNCFSLNKILKSFPNKGTEMEIFYYNSRNNSKQYNIFTLENIGFENIDNCQTMPVIPFYECSLKNDVNQDLLINTSGVPVFNKIGKILGILSSYNKKTDKFKIIPGYFIHKLIDDFINNKPDEISCLPLNYKLLNNELVLIDDDSKLQKNDIIIKLDHRIVDSDGNIYFPSIKYKIPLDTYILLNFNFNEKISISIKRLNDSKTIFNHFLMKKKLTSISNILKIDNKYNNKFINIDGLTFCELSIPLIKILYKYYNTKIDYNFIGLINSHDNLSLNREKIIILINSTYNKLNVDLDNIFQLKKINNNKIYSINDLYKYISNNRLQSINLISKDKKINFIF